MFNVNTFRTQFPEFASTVTYPDSMINFWAALGMKLLPEAVWTTCWDEGVSLYVAHEITLAAANEKAASVGGNPGTFGGPANNKTVGKASVGYDTASTAEKDAGWYNLTNYGKQLYRLIRLFGARCVQL